MGCLCSYMRLPPKRQYLVWSAGKLWHTIRSSVCSRVNYRHNCGIHFSLAMSAPQLAMACFGGETSRPLVCLPGYCVLPALAKRAVATKAFVSSRVICVERNQVFYKSKSTLLFFRYLSCGSHIDR